MSGLARWMGKAVVLAIGAMGMAAPAGSGSAIPNSQRNAQSPRVPVIAAQQRVWLAYPARDVPQGDFDRAVNDNAAPWPEMQYLNERSLIAGRTVTPEEARVVPGGGAAQYFNPKTGERLSAEDALARGYPRPTTGVRLPFVMLPPEGSLLMIRIKVDPPGGHWTQSWQYVCDDPGYKGPIGDAFRIAYPGLGEVPIAYNAPAWDESQFDFGQYNSPPARCLGDGWLYFYLPAVNPDISQVWLEYVFSTGDKAFWTLAKRP